MAHILWEFASRPHSDNGLESYMASKKQWSRSYDWYGIDFHYETNGHNG